jgi:hypothetical protein
MEVIHMRKSLLAAVLAAATLTAGVAVPVASQAQDEAPTAADGALTFSGGAVAAGIGFVWGSGQLEYQGQPYPVKISGISVVDVGAARIDASGSVYHLKRLEDFNGTYTAFAAGATIAGGGGVAYLRNQNGVVIKLNSTSEGLRFNLSAKGVQLKLQS